MPTGLACDGRPAALYATTRGALGTSGGAASMTE